MLALLASLLSESSKKTILRDFTLWSISLVFEMNLGGGRLLDTGRLLEEGGV